MARWTARQYRRYIAGRLAPLPPCIVLRAYLHRVRRFWFYKRLVDPEDKTESCWVYVDTERFKAKERAWQARQRTIERAVELLGTRAQARRHARRLGLPLAAAPLFGRR